MMPQFRLFREGSWMAAFEKTSCILIVFGVEVWQGGAGSDVAVKASIGQTPTTSRFGRRIHT